MTARIMVPVSMRLDRSDVSATLDTRATADCAKILMNAISEATRARLKPIA
jgi:hypothetical protein